jgi:hypothetical protein
VDCPCYFQDYGLGPRSKYSHCAYGVGDTEEEALVDCMENMAQAAGFDFNEEVEKRIRADYGNTDTDTIASDCYGCECGDCERAYVHVGIKWNER